MFRILLVGDYDERIVAHTAIPRAMALAGGAASPEWLGTSKIKSEQDIAKQAPNGIWCVPGSPYQNMDGALAAIRFARERKIPFLGTCGGFQHALIEFARNVLGIADADHLESNPEAVAPVISKLACSLIHKSESISLKERSALQQIYKTNEISEEYQCSYGVNPDWIKRFEGSDLNFVAFAAGQPRAFELHSHPFFFGALFQPERSEKTGRAHPLITAFYQAAQAGVV